MQPPHRLHQHEPGVVSLAPHRGGLPHRHLETQWFRAQGKGEFEWFQRKGEVEWFRGKVSWNGSGEK